MEAPRTPRLKLRVTAAAQAAVRSGHPWVFADSIREQNRPGVLGELAVLYDKQDRFLAVGLFDPDSPLRVRILHAGKPQTLDQAWWRQHLAQTLARRDGLFDDQTTGYRCIHGENDRWPGLVLDRYGSTLVVKLYTAAWLPRLAELRELFAAQFAGQADRLILRLSRNIQDIAAKQFQASDGQPIGFGPDTPASAPEQGGVALFLETGIRFEAEVYRGQKTGFYLDQRENRRRVGQLARGLDVLNAFSFSGGFSLYAAQGGAKSVTDLDISEHALGSSRRNFALNHDQPAIKNCAHHTVQGDVFAWLERNTRPQFDVVILDPPSLARRESDRAGAIQAYGRLAAGGIQLLRRSGILVAASCSAHVTAAEFFQAVRQAAQRSGRAFQELATTAHPPDHPANFPEAHYLKGIYLRF